MIEDVQHSEEVKPEEASNSEDGALENLQGLGEDVSVEDLGIDLEALSLNSPKILGRANPKPNLTVGGDKRGVGRPPSPDEGVFAWCEQFNYTPGVEFLKLHRMFPKTWEGLGIGGFIEEVYEPIDEHWLVERWGGGSYQLDAYQRDNTGRSRKTKVKCVEISGLPKAYMGTDGRPHPLSHQRTNSSNSRRSSDVLRRRIGLGKMRSRDGDSPDFSAYDDEDVESVPRSRTSNIDKPLVDASQLYKAMQDNKRSENEALGVIREAQKDVHSQMQETSKQQNAMYQTLLDQQKDEMSRLREEGRTQAEASSAPFKEMLKFLSLKGESDTSSEVLEALRQTHNTSIQVLTKEHTNHLSELQRSYEVRQSQITDELQRVRSQYASDIEQVRGSYLDKEKSTKDDAFRMYQSQLESLRNQNSETRERHRDELSNLQRDKVETITQLRQDVSELRAASLTQDSTNRLTLIEKENSLRKEGFDREQLLQKKILSLETLGRTILLEERQRLKEEYESQFTSKFENLKVSYETRFQVLSESSELKIETAKKEAKSISDLAISRLESDIRSMKTEYDSKENLSFERSKLAQEVAQKERETQRLILENTSKSKDALNNMKILELKTALDTAKKEQEAQDQRADPISNDPFEQLDRLTQIKERLKSHGFISEKGSSEEDMPEVEEKPKDFLGKLLHYGPQVVAPILQRIDAATAVAQQAVSQQQGQEATQSRQDLFEKQQRLEMERAAAIQREQALREHREMLQQRRIEREDLIAQEQAAQRATQTIHPSTQPTYTEEPPQNSDLPEDIRGSSESNTEKGNVMATEEGSDYTAVGEYLSKALSEGKGVQQVVNEINTAKMLGYFSTDDLHRLLSEDFEILMGNLSTFPSLRSPKSRIKIRQIINGLKA